MSHEITNASRTSKILDSSFIVGEYMLLVIQNEKRHQEARVMFYGFLTGSRAPWLGQGCQSSSPQSLEQSPRRGRKTLPASPAGPPQKRAPFLYRGNSTERNLMGQLTRDGLVNPIHAGPVKMHHYGRTWGVLVGRHQTCGNMATRIFKAK